jgi:hypothetical protein
MAVGCAIIAINLAVVLALVVGRLVGFRAISVCYKPQWQWLLCQAVRIDRRHNCAKYHYPLDRAAMARQ